jgi:hypothetical protein
MFDFRQLRKLYGRSPNGESNRRNFRVTITPETFGMLSSIVEVGFGKYGSSFVELSIRLMFALVTQGEDLDQVAIELKNSCVSPYLINNLKRLARLMEA